MVAISTKTGRSTTDDHATEMAQTPAPPLAPAEQVIDLDQLARMSLGERSLEREVLTLFNLQAGILVQRMVGEDPKYVAGLAHTLSGSARGVGAWKVAEAAAAVERLASAPEPIMPSSAMSRLSAAVSEAQAAIAKILRVP